MNVAARITVTAAEFTRQFGQLRQTLGDRPVFVTHHGRETHVLLSTARFVHLREQRGPEHDDRVPAGIVQWVRDGIIVLDSNSKVLVANDQAHALLGCGPGTLPGERIWTAVPALRGTAIETIVLRALAAREPACVDLPSSLRPGAWLQFDLHPTHDGVTVLLRDITAEVARDRLADEAAATDRACASHVGVAKLRLNMRGHIVAADETACSWVGLDAERLRGVAVADLMPTARKSDFRTALDKILTEGGETGIGTALLANQGGPLPIAATLVALNGCYGIEGAVMLATRSGDGTTG